LAILAAVKRVSIERIRAFLLEFGIKPGRIREVDQRTYPGDQIFAVAIDVLGEDWRPGAMCPLELQTELRSRFPKIFQILEVIYLRKVWSFHLLVNPKEFTDYYHEEN
jgi:hypothetical protein